MQEDYCDGKNTAITQQVILLDYRSFSKQTRLIAIDLSKRIELGSLDTTQQINFIGRLGRDERETMFFFIIFLAEKILHFSQNVVIIV